MIGVDSSQLLVAVLLAALAAVLATSAFGKAANSGRFARIIERHDIVPRGLAHVTAWGVIGVELILVAALLSGFAVLQTSVATAGLFTAFAMLSGRLVASGRKVPCGCFGADERSVASWLTVARSMALAGVAGDLALASERAGAPSPAAVIALTVALVLASALVGALRQAVSQPATAST